MDSNQLKVRKTSSSPNPPLSLLKPNFEYSMEVKTNAISTGRNHMDSKDIDVKVKDTTANPAPLGLAGFGMTTVLLNLHNA